MNFNELPRGSDYKYAIVHSPALEDTTAILCIPQTLIDKISSVRSQILDKRKTDPFWKDILSVKIEFDEDIPSVFTDNPVLSFAYVDVAICDTIRWSHIEKDIKSIEDRTPFNNVEIFIRDEGIEIYLEYITFNINFSDTVYINIDSLQHPKEFNTIYAEAEVEWDEFNYAGHRRRG